MTLIVSFSVLQYQFILGDLLISAPQHGSDQVHLPTIGEVSPIFPTGSQFVPSRLQRKICQFGNVAVAWAGRYLAAKAIIESLVSAFQRTGPLNEETLHETFSHLDPWLQDSLRNGDVCLLGYLIDEQTNRNIGFGTNYTQLTSSILDEVKVAGSGRGLFENYFDHKSQSGLEVPPSKLVGSFGRAMASALAVTGMLLQLEIGTRSTLLDYFGGGFELVALNGNRFIMCDDLMYAFWFADIDNQGTRINPVMKFFKQAYDQDVMIVRTLEMKTPDPSDPLFLTKRVDEVHYFPPIYRKMSQQEIMGLSKPDLSAFMLCSHVLVRMQSGVEVITRLDWSRDRKIPLRFNDDGKFMTVNIKASYMDEIFSAIESRLSGDGHASPSAGSRDESDN